MGVPEVCRTHLYHAGYWGDVGSRWRGEDFIQYISGGVPGSTGGSGAGGVSHADASVSSSESVGSSVRWWMSGL